MSAQVQAPAAYTQRMDTPTDSPTPPASVYLDLTGIRLEDLPKQGTVLDVMLARVLGREPNADGGISAFNSAI